jgi:hypothetical protein
MCASIKKTRQKPVPVTVRGQAFDFAGFLAFCRNGFSESISAVG